MSDRPSTSGGGHRPRASVVIPAHNEAAVIAECLQDVVSAGDPGELEIVVVCNGCSDDTAKVAASFAGVTVLEMEVASKTGALNAGDRAATVFPRLYLDADIRLEASSLRAVVSALEAGHLAAAPVIVFDTTGCSAGSRLYHTVRSRLGYVRSHVLGAGFFGLSEAARARFKDFPAVVNDDGFVYGLFRPEERHNPTGATFTVRAPRTLRAVYRRQVRIAVGNLQLARCGHELTPPGPGWLDVVRAEPRLALAAAVYVAVHGAAALSARRLVRAGSLGGWNRDDTTRAASSHHGWAA